MKVLEVGPNKNPQAQLFYKDAQIVTLDIDPAVKPDIVADAGDMPKELWGQFDALFASHVLEHFSYWHTTTILQGWRRIVKPDGGQVFVIVPSLEWAAEQILSEQPSKALWGHLFGGHVSEHDIHLAGFTMRYLRACFEQAGLRVGLAQKHGYKLMFQEKEYEAEVLYVIGGRYDV